ncbi:MAG: superoxide dismutase [Lewinellaceae bacterium]|nr:superoxide dismutase [Saprospiraceae bacterium]MCB9339871.1 superoxide dismutase [Lewinellaceae bacterium]
MAFQLPALPYSFDALEPHIDARTMEIHHGKHHAGYTTNLNNAIAGTPLEGMKIEDILANVSQHGMAVRNNGGGYYNHSLFWEVMSPDGGGEPSAQMNIAKAIDRDFGSFENFKKEFSAAAATRFGSGWAWLCTDSHDKLFVTSTPNQDNPLMDVADKKGTPILGLDVWEHAYYLNYQNRRPDYISSFFNIINWAEVTKRYNDANPGAMKG